MIAFLFWLLTTLACGYAWVCGGKEGRWAAGLIIGACFLTIPASLLGPRFGRFEPAVFSVDLGLLVGLYLLALGSLRCWPIWMAGFHLVAVFSHLGTLLAPRFVAKVYFAAETFWAIPVLIAMITGIALDRSADTRESRDGDPHLRKHIEIPERT